MQDSLKEKGVTMEMQKDPVCGMSIDSKGKQSSNYQGKTYYFCSADCKRAFDDHPDNYIREQARKDLHL